MGNATIFSSNSVRALKNALGFGTDTDANTTAVVSTTLDPTANSNNNGRGSLFLNSSNGHIYRKLDISNTTNVIDMTLPLTTPISNYFTNPIPDNNVTNFTSYLDTSSVTFQDTGDTVTLNNHGLQTINRVSFTAITSTTGISTNTEYWVVNPTTNTFQLATSQNGSALPLTTNGTGTMVRDYPINATSGTSTIVPTIALNTSSPRPIGTTYCFTWTKSANTNAMGGGFKFDFTLANGDLGQMITISFEYVINSGTFNLNDMNVWIKNASAGTFIQPAGYQILPGSTANQMKFQATFQAGANSAQRSYRICFHGSNVSYANAFTILANSMYIGPSQKTYGVPVSDWTSFTPTGTWSSNITYSGWYRRVGDTAEIRIVGSITGSVAGGGSLNLNMPPGLVIDTTKINTGSDGNVLGEFRILRTGSDDYLGVVSYLTTTTVDIRVQATPSGANPVYVGNSTSVSPTVPATWANGDSFTAIFQVPISGWSSNTLMSSSTSQNVVACVLSGSTTSITSSGVTITPTTIVNDTNGAFSGSTYTVPVPGFYQIEAYLAGANTAQTSGNGFQVGYKVNAGAAVLFGSQNLTANVTTIMTASGSKVVSLKAGDQITFYSAATTTQTPTDFQASIFRLSGPAQIAATETVACSYASSAGNTLTNNAFTYVDFATKNFDSNNAVLGAGSGNSATASSTWRFVAPVAGTYLISAITSVIANTAGNLDFVTSVWKNGSSEVFRGSRYYLTTTGFVNSGTMTSLAAGLVALYAGDYISISAYLVNGANRSQSTAAQDNYVSIVRVGN